MKNNISPRLLFAVIGRGIKQAAMWVAKLFGYKEGTTFGKIVWRVFALSASLVMFYIAVIFTYFMVEEVGDKIDDMKRNSRTYCHHFDNQYVSPYVIYHDGPEGGYLYNTLTGERTLTDIKWVCKSDDGDSLVFFVSNGKRGYFNRFTGEVAIPVQYDKAWVFSEGVACVYKDGVITFIDHNGNQVMDKKFPYSGCINGYTFHNGLCAMLDDNELMGIINLQGEWVVKPEYYFIGRDETGFWRTENYDDEEGLINANGVELLPVGYDNIRIDTQNELIYARTLDNFDMVFNFDGEVVNACAYDGVYKLRYETKELDNDGCFKQAEANLMSYYTSGRSYGLIDYDGNLITQPIYSDITALSANRYQCEGPLGTVILNDKGEECKN